MSMQAPAGMGDNQPDHAKMVMDRLAADYAEIDRSVAAALEEARVLPAEVESEAVQSIYAATIKKLRDLSDRVEALRVAEKEPYLRSGNAVDSWFGNLRSKLFRKNKTDKAGAADVLQARVNAYVQRKEAEERQRREEADRKAREEALRIQREREEAERLQREEEARAARARKAENEEAARARAAAAAAEAERLRIEEKLANEERQRTAAEAAAKAADLVRTRTEGGHLVTAKQQPHVEIIDEMELDPVALWPFVKSDAKLAALKAWAKITQHKKPMKGALIEMRSVAEIR